MRELVLPDDFSGGLVKVCSWEPFYKDGLTQVPYVRKLATNRLNSKEQVFAKIAKLQSKDTADLVQAFLDSYPVKVGHTYFLDTALGAFEGWGANSNGDAFLEEDLLLDSEDHGYKSFRKHAHVFRHHQNKDPLASIGRVVLASYNHKMRRVELIEEVDNTKAADLLQKWDDEGSLGTSMGCFPDPTTPIWTIHDGWKPISEIKAGDMVWSGEANPQRVSYPMVRKYDGDVYEVRFVGRRRPIEATAEHPFRVVRRAKVWTDKLSNGLPKRAMDVQESAAEYVRADGLNVGDYLVQPIPFVERGDFGGCTRDWARLAGYYLAEGFGHLSNDGKQVYPWFIVNKDDEAAWEIPHLVEQIAPGTTVTITPHQQSEKAINIQVFSDKIGRTLRGWCGRTSSDKRVASFLLEAPKWWQLEFLGAYLNGDGCFSGEKIFASTKSEGLAHDILMLFARVGMLGGVQEIHHQPSAVVAKPTTEYQVRVGAATHFTAMASTCAKVRVVETTKSSSNSPKILTSWAILTPITAIRKRRHVGPVYNFAVEGDDSYVACGVAVHNCKVAFDICMVCQNRAKTAAEYCKHAKYEMNHVYADGSRACVRNPNPRFFDQSHVIVPADKIAGAMLKVASYTGQSVEGFEMPKVIPSALVGQALAMEEAVDKAAMEKTARPIEIREGQIFWSPEQLEAQKVAASDPEFPLSLLEDLAKYPLQKVASTLAQLAIVPSPREWQYLALCHAGQEKLAQELHQAGECFDPDPRINADPEDVDMMLVDPAAMDGEIAVKLAEWIPLRSAEPMFLAPRLSIARGELVGGEKHASALREGVGLWMRMHDKLAAAVVPPEKIRKENPRLGEIFLALAASYGMARAAGGKMYGARILADLERSTGLNPALAAALLAIGATGAIGLADKAVSPNQITRTKEAAGGPWVGGPSQSGGGFWNWIRETPEPITSVVLPFSAGYMSSAWYRAKQMRGEPTNSVQNVIADHPLASGVGATGALALIRRALRRKP